MDRVANTNVRDVIARHNNVEAGALGATPIIGTRTSETLLGDDNDVGRRGT
jgi:hypothetical protein